MTRVLLAGLLAVGTIGCTSITTTPAPTVDVVSPPPSPLVLPSVADVPSPDASIVLPTELPPVTPTDTLAATQTPKPTKAPASNLVVSKFEIDADFVLAEVPVDAVFTVRNNGTVNAGRFQTAILATNDDDGTKGQSDPFAVDAGLGAGESIKVTISLTLPTDGNWTIAAAADTEDAVAESNEKDNSQDAKVKVLSGLPDLAWKQDGFTATDSGTATDDGHKIELEAKFTNVGTAALDQTIVIAMTWYRDQDGASGDLVSFPVADVMARGADADLSKIDFLPGTGTYKIYADIDGEHVLDELNYDNNETSATVTIP